MTRLVYLIAEGVTDVTLLSRVVRRYFAMEQVKAMEALPGEAREWLTRGFKWPHGEDIARLAVPAPVFMQREGLLVALRNAQGLTRINETLDADDAVFELIPWAPVALGVFVDADTQEPAKRFDLYRNDVKVRARFPLLRARSRTTRRSGGRSIPLGVVAHRWRTPGMRPLRA